MRGPTAERKGLNNQKFQPPLTAGLSADTCQHHLCLPAPGSAAAVSQQLEKCLWSQQCCTVGYLVLCNGFSVPVSISSPESGEREWAGLKGFGESCGFAVELWRRWHSLCFSRHPCRLIPMENGDPVWTRCASCVKGTVFCSKGKKETWKSAACIRLSLGPA